ncbi:MAG TPA: NAD(P)H-dependent oxidoreductase [bacterium]|nr:NAD(P)H-dependent oxidoreductase [bacterium]
MSKKIVVFHGSPRRKETYAFVQQFEKALAALGPVEVEHVLLKDANIQFCRGCFACLSRGEEFCPLKDDIPALVAKMHAADGVVFATPNYSLQVTAIMKNFLDRCAFIFHRPALFHKVSIALVTQGAIGGEKIVSYLDEVCGYWGFIVVKGACVTTIRPLTQAEEKKVAAAAVAAVHRFHAALHGDLAPQPSLFRLAIFRVVRAMHRFWQEEDSRDYRHFRDNGWFESAYYYPVKLCPGKRLIGALVDLFGTRMARSRKRELEK